MDISRGGGSTRQPLRTEPCLVRVASPGRAMGHCKVKYSLCCAAGVVGPALGAAAELGRWFVRAAVLPVCGEFQRRRQHSATTAHRALPVTTNMQRVKIVRSAFSVQNCRQVFVVRGQINADTLVCIFYYSLCMHSAKYENVNQNDQKISSC